MYFRNQLAEIFCKLWQFQTNAFYHWTLGLLYGYPLCCIKQFVQEVGQDILPSLTRYEKHPSGTIR